MRGAQISRESIAILEHIALERASAEDRDFEEAATRRAVLRLFSGPGAYRVLSLGEITSLLSVPKRDALQAVNDLLQRGRLVRSRGELRIARAGERGDLRPINGTVTLRCTLARCGRMFEAVRKRGPRPAFCSEECRLESIELHGVRRRVR